MKIDELIRRVGVDNVAIQVLNTSVTAAKQRKGYVEVSFGTDCVSMHDIATGEWEGIVYIVRVSRSDFDAAVDASAKKKPAPEAIEATASLIANGLLGQATEQDVREVERQINELLGVK